MSTAWVHVKNLRLSIVVGLSLTDIYLIWVSGRIYPIPSCTTVRRNHCSGQYAVIPGSCRTSGPSTVMVIVHWIIRYWLKINIGVSALSRLGRAVCVEVVWPVCLISSMKFGAEAVMWLSQCLILELGIDMSPI